MNKFIATILITYDKKIKSKSFLIITLILMSIIVIAFNFDKIENKFENEDKIGIVTQSENDYNKIKKVYSHQEKKKLEHFTSYNKAKELLNKKEIDSFITFKVNNSGKIKANLYSKTKVTDSDLSELKQRLVPLQQIYTASKHNLNEHSAKELYQNSDVNSHVLNEDGNKLSSSERNFNTILSYVLLITLVFILMNYINQISMEIANEKTSRVIEMIITSVPAYQHVLSKITGVILVALTQILILLFTFFVSYKLFDGKQLFNKFDLDVTSANIDVIIIALIVWLLAVIGYIILGALVGSLVSRIEDLGQAIMPLSLIILISFYIAFFNFSSPDSKILTLCSYIPYISPFAILAQLGGDTYNVITIIISILINIIVIFISLIIVSKSFKSTILSFDKSLFSNIKRIIGK